MNDAVRQHQGRPRGAAGHRPPVHVGAARDGRAGRLAADHVPRPPTARRSGAAPISRRSRAGAGRRSARCCRASPEAYRTGARDGGAEHRRAARTRWRGMSTADSGRPAEAPVHLDAVAAALLRMNDPEHGGLQRRAEIPQPADLPLPLAERLPHRRGRGPGRAAPDAAAHVAGRHLRPSRRRLCALFHRRGLAGAAFREDAVRQRPDRWSCWRWPTRTGPTRCMPSAPTRRSAGWCAT